MTFFLELLPSNQPLIMCVIYEKEDVIMNALLQAGFIIKSRKEEVLEPEEKKKRGRPKKQVEEVVVQKKRVRPKKVQP